MEACRRDGRRFEAFFSGLWGAGRIPALKASIKNGNGKWLPWYRDLVDINRVFRFCNNCNYSVSLFEAHEKITHREITDQDLIDYESCFWIIRQ